MHTGSIVRQESEAEVVLKEHRRWTRWIRGHRNLGEGNLTLTNRRMLFMHRIASSPDVSANIKKLSDASIESVLNYALTLHKNNFQIPLASIVKVGTGFYLQFFVPHFYLQVSYHQGKKKVLSTVAFRFRMPVLELLLHPQIVEDWKWVSAIKKAIGHSDTSANRER